MSSAVTLQGTQRADARMTLLLMTVWCQGRCAFLVSLVLMGPDWVEVLTKTGRPKTAHRAIPLLQSNHVYTNLRRSFHWCT